MRLAVCKSSAPAPCQRRAAAFGGSRSTQPLTQRPTSSSRGGSGGSGPRRRQAAVAAALEEEEEELENTAGGTADVTLQASTSYSSIEEEGMDESRDFAVAMAKVAWDTKAEDILVLNVAPVVYWTRYMLIATVFSRPQLNAILGKMEKVAVDEHDRRLSTSPKATSGGWELLDYGDVVIHILTADQREYYDLEGFYGAAEDVALPFSQEAVADVDTWSKKL